MIGQAVGVSPGQGWQHALYVVAKVGNVNVQQAVVIGIEHRGGAAHETPPPEKGSIGYVFEALLSGIAVYAVGVVNVGDHHILMTVVVQICD